VKTWASGFKTQGAETQDDSAAGANESLPTYIGVVHMSVPNRRLILLRWVSLRISKYFDAVPKSHASTTTQKGIALVGGFSVVLPVHPAA
jgi:hypothetical protein